MILRLSYIFSTFGVNEAVVAELQQLGVFSAQALCENRIKKRLSFYFKLVISAYLHHRLLLCTATIRTVTRIVTSRLVSIQIIS